MHRVRLMYHTAQSLRIFKNLFVRGPDGFKPCDTKEFENLVTQLIEVKEKNRWRYCQVVT